MMHGLDDLSLRPRKGLQNGRFLEKRHARNLQDCVEAHVEIESLLDDCYQDIGADGRPDLSLQCVWARAHKRLDSQVLLDPFEKEFDMPAAAIQVGDCLWRQDKVVGQEDQSLPAFGIEKTDTAQTLGVSLHRVEPFQQNRLIALNASRFVDIVRDYATETEVLPRPGNEKCAGQSPATQPRKIEVSAVHNVESSRLQHDVIEEKHIVQLGRCNADNGGDLASQIEYRVKLHGVLIGLVGRPGKEAEAQVDSSRIQSIDGIAELDTQILVSIKFASLGNQHLSEVRINSPIPHFVGTGQCGSRDAAAEAHMIEPLALRSQAGDNIAQAFAIRKLRKKQAQKLIPTREGSDAMIASISRHALAEFMHGEMVEKLREDGPPNVHAMPSVLAEHGGAAIGNSNRLRPSSVLLVSKQELASNRKKLTGH